MITDPQNVFEILQNDVAEQIMATSPFDNLANPDGSTPFRVLTEDEGDIQFEFDAMIQQLGLSIVVKAPTAKPINPDLPGPFLILAFDVWVSEAVTFNRTPAGTQIRAMRAAKIIMETLHGFVPSSPQINTPVQYNGFDIERERSYVEGDQPGTLVVSRICHFLCPLATA